jgi:hypothetical protein
VLQAADGTVHMTYDALNRFTPPGSKATGRTVNDDLYIQLNTVAAGPPKVAGRAVFRCPTRKKLANMLASFFLVK